MKDEWCVLHIQTSEVAELIEDVVASKGFADDFRHDLKPFY